MSDMNTNIEELSDIQSESGVIGTLIYHPEFILHGSLISSLIIVIGSHSSKIIVLSSASLTC